MGAGSETYIQTICRESKIEISIGSFPLELGEPTRRGKGKIVGVKEDGGQQEKMAH